MTKKTKTKKIRFDVVTIFPEIFRSYLDESLLGKARKRGLVDVKLWNLRGFAIDKHRKVDDKPFGGGPGMVIKIEPVYRAVQFLKSKISAKGGSASGGKSKKLKVRTILFSTRGEKMDSRIARRLSKYNELILICGRYEGVDERVARYVADEEISIGDYVLSGGELPAMVLIEAVSRYLPGFLGKTESLEEIKGSYPVYTRPEIFSPSLTSAKGGQARLPAFGRNKKIRKYGKIASSNRKRARWAVPKVLLSGNHKKIAEWRRK